MGDKIEGVHTDLCPGGANTSKTLEDNPREDTYLDAQRGNSSSSREGMFKLSYLSLENQKTIKWEMRLDEGHSSGKHGEPMHGRGQPRGRPAV